MAPRHFLDFAFHAGGMGNSLCTVVAGLLLASTLDVSLVMDRHHASSDQSITRLLGMDRGDACGEACGAGRVAPAACAAGLARARLDVRSGSKKGRKLARARTPQILAPAKLEAWRSPLAGAPGPAGVRCVRDPPRRVPPFAAFAGAARAAGLHLRVDDAGRGPGRGRALRRVDPVDVIYSLPRFPLSYFTA